MWADQELGNRTLTYLACKRVIFSHVHGKRSRRKEWGMYSLVKKKIVRYLQWWNVYKHNVGGNNIFNNKLVSINAVFTLDAGLLARSQYSEGPATGHLDTCFSWFPCVYKQMLRRFPKFQVATTCFSCSPPDLNLLVTNFMFCIHVK